MGDGTRRKRARDKSEEWKTFLYSMLIYHKRMFSRIFREILFIYPIISPLHSSSTQRQIFIPTFHSRTILYVANVNQFEGSKNRKTSATQHSCLTCDRRIVLPFMNIYQIHSFLTSFPSPLEWLYFNPPPPLNIELPRGAP